MDVRLTRRTVGILILAEAVSGPYSRLDGRRHVAVEALNADGDERVGAQTRVCTLGLQGSASHLHWKVDIASSHQAVMGNRISRVERSNGGHGHDQAGGQAGEAAAHKQPRSQMKVLVYGRNGWIGGLLGECLRSKSINFEYGRARLEDRRGIEADIRRVRL